MCNVSLWSWSSCISASPTGRGGWFRPWFNPGLNVAVGPIDSLNTPIVPRSNQFKLLTGSLYPTCRGRAHPGSPAHSQRAPKNGTARPGHLLVTMSWAERVPSTRWTPLKICPTARMAFDSITFMCKCHIEKHLKQHKHVHMPFFYTQMYVNRVAINWKSGRKRKAPRNCLFGSTRRWNLHVRLLAGVLLSLVSGDDSYGAQRIPSAAWNC